MRTLLFCACAIALAGCVEAEERSTDLEYVHAAIIEPNCATIGCHSRATAATPPDVDPPEAYSPIDLSTPSRACRILVNEWGPPVVMALLDGVYSDPSEDPNPVYAQMPLDIPLPAADIEVVRAWITGTDPCE
jgi:hypothetical protein